MSSYSYTNDYSNDFTSSKKRGKKGKKNRNNLNGYITEEQVEEQIEHVEEQIEHVEKEEEKVDELNLLNVADNSKKVEEEEQSDNTVDVYNQINTEIFGLEKTITEKVSHRSEVCLEINNEKSPNVKELTNEIERKLDTLVEENIKSNILEQPKKKETTKILVSQPKANIAVPKKVLPNKQIELNKNVILDIEPDTNAQIEIEREESEINPMEQIIYFPKKLGYAEVEKAIRTSYYTKQDYYSAAFDIIATYIKGQKLLYIESQQYCKKNYHYMIMPAIFLAVAASVMALSLEEFWYGPLMVSSICAFNTFLISLATYSKLEGAAEAHKISSHQYDKLQSMCEFTSGRMMVLPTNGKEDSTSEIKLDEIESRIRDIKEANNHIVPKYIRNLLPKIYHTNIFSLVKQITNFETLYINDIKDDLNELRVLEYKQKVGDVTNDDKILMINLRKSIRKHTRNLIELKSEYNQIDLMFRKEIDRANNKYLFRCGCSIFENDDDYKEGAKLRHLYNKRA
jgi:hypothetical protein